MSKNYRRIYERHHQCSLLTGVDIHHIDGNHANNDPTNLQAVTLQEHYNIHKEEKNYYACVLIAQRMQIKPDDWKKMAQENGRRCALENIRQGVGLIHWHRNNPDLARAAASYGGTLAGKKCYEEKLGIHGLSPEQKTAIGKKGGAAAAAMGFGFKAGHASAAGKIGGKKGGQWAKENRTGIFALTPEQIKAKGQKAAITKLINNGRACAWPRKATS